MPIEANVTNQQITASVGETKIDVSVGGGVGPTGPAGPPGPAGTASSHASTHAAGGSDPVTLTVGQVTGLQAALDGKQAAGSYVVTSDARMTDAREWSASTVTQADAEAGTSTTRVAFTPLRVFQAIAAWWSGVSVPWAKLTGVPVTFAPSSHTHDASAMASGTLDIARIPTGATSTTVALGNHAHSTLEDVTLAGDTHFNLLLGGNIEADEILLGGSDLAATLAGKASSSHAHGNLTSTGAIGSTSGLVVVTGASGALTTAATISAATQVSGLSAVATSGSASDLTSGTLAAARIGAHAASHNPGGSDAVSLVEFYEFTRTTAPSGATGGSGSWTWTPPATAKAIEFLIISAGSGGGSGRRGAAGTARFGGGGGAGGSVIQCIVPRSLITTAITMTIRAGGAGGAAVTTDDTNGNAGSAPAATIVTFNGYSWLLATNSGNAGGSGGTTSAGSGTSANAAWARTFLGGTGTSSSATANAPDSLVGVGQGMVTLGGSAGGGISSGNVAYSGGVQSFAGVATNLAYTGTTASTTGGNASTTAAGGTGGNGITYGCGGCGGGASANGFASGAGGSGGDGFIRITVWY